VPLTQSSIAGKSWTIESAAHGNEIGLCSPSLGIRIRLDSLPLLARAAVLIMAQLINVNPTSEHGLYLRLFVTTSGGW
jgi:hypothetical protein